MELRIGLETPNALALMLEMGSFEKLRFLKPVINNIDDAEYWFEKAIPMTVDELENEVALVQAVREANSNPVVITSESQRRIWKSAPEPLADLRRRTLRKIIPETEEIPDTAVIEITARIVEFGDVND